MECGRYINNHPLLPMKRGSGVAGAFLEWWAMRWETIGSTPDDCMKHFQHIIASIPETSSDSTGTGNAEFTFKFV